MNRLNLKKWGCSLLMLWSVVGAQAATTDSTTVATSVLYHRVLQEKGSYPELVLNNTPARFTAEGLQITGPGEGVRLHRYYALADRLIRYQVRLSADAQASFFSHSGDFRVNLDVPSKTLSMMTQPELKKSVPFLNPDHEYLVEISRHYQDCAVRLIDLMTGDEETIRATQDGIGGYGAGIVNVAHTVGMQHDYYCFGLNQGSSLWVKQICVEAGACNLTLLLYGDSITEPENYYPTADYPQSWTQLILSHVKGKAMSSGRGGTTINELLERIPNELPYIKAKYVMVTIGTNGGNTEENLSRLVEYILSQGSIPILNNIPSNEHATQIEVNAMIEKVRQKYGIKGCRFDLPTSIDFDGQKVNTEAMWYEDYGVGNAYYHHPNVKGSRLMYLRTLVDVPEIYQ